MIQPNETAAPGSFGPSLFSVGCAGRITSFAETGDGRYVITLTGIARFRILEEIRVRHDLSPLPGHRRAVRRRFRGARRAPRRSTGGRCCKTFRAYLDAHNLEADWESVGRASNETLINALAMMAPFGAAEKQALLEAPDLRARAETLVAITEMTLARDVSGGNGRSLQ